MTQVAIEPPFQWRLQPDAVDVAKGPRLSSGGKSPNNELICLLVSVTLYSTLGFEETFLDYCGRKQQNQCLLIKTTHVVVYMYSLLCVFISQCSNKVDFISVCEVRGCFVRSSSNLERRSHIFLCFLCF